MNLPKMICPRCGAEMNHHATKSVWVGKQLGEAEMAFGEVLEEFHSCPKCGASASRPA